MSSLRIKPSKSKTDSEDAHVEDDLVQIIHIYYITGFALDHNSKALKLYRIFTIN